MMKKLMMERVGRAETAVRQNRVGLMVAIKKVLGPEYWRKLEAEMGPMGMGAFPRRVRIERRLEHPAAPAAPGAGQGREERER